MENTAKNFALQLGAVLSLYVVIVSLINLLFGVITVNYPDVAEGSWAQTSASESIRVTIAFLVVFFPAYLVLTRTINTIRRRETGAYLGLTRWIMYLSLLVGGGVLLGDIVTVLIQFLNGELTIRFLLKALSVLVVVGAACAYYLADVRGYWQTHEKQSIYYGVAVSLVVLSAIVLGFGHTETPSEVREARIDITQINDLSMMQSTVESYVSLHNTLPESLEVAFGALPIPQAPEGRMEYTYERKSATVFALCAEFKTAANDYQGISYPIEGGIIKNAYNWNHTTGVWCFERSISFENSTKR